MHNAHSTWLHHTSHFIHCSQLGAVAMHNILQNAHFTAHRVTSAQCTAHTLLSDGSSGPQWVPRLDLEAAAIRCERGVTKSRRQHWHNVETQATPDIMNLRQFRGSLLLDLQFIRATRWKSWPNQEITVVIKLCGRKFESSWLLLIVYFEKILCEYSNSRHSLNPDPPPNSLFLNFSSPPSPRPELPRGPWSIQMGFPYYPWKKYFFFFYARLKCPFLYFWVRKYIYSIYENTYTPLSSGIILT